ncbi:MAG: hypothetical protein D6808_06480 [Candidatus Dadabacteria bacterium]|nr:MAG: hypothetical protein D6808_06480 [Candidatus Dadabacteria bacterium]
MMLNDTCEEGELGFDFERAQQILRHDINLGLRHVVPSNLAQLKKALAVQERLLLKHFVLGGRERKR